MLTCTRWSFAEDSVDASPAYFPCDARCQSGVVGCWRMWPHVGMCYCGLHVAICEMASLVEFYGEIGVANLAR